MFIIGRYELNNIDKLMQYGFVKILYISKFLECELHPTNLKQDDTNGMFSNFLLFHLI